MDLILYIKCFLVAVIGFAIFTGLKMKSMQDKARSGNIQFSAKDYFKDDWISICVSLLTIIMFLLFIDEILNLKPAMINYVLMGFAFVGYTSSDIASRLFSVANKRLNKAIDEKTTIADTTTGNLSKPTSSK